MAHHRSPPFALPNEIRRLCGRRFTARLHRLPATRNCCKSQAGDFQSVQEPQPRNRLAANSSSLLAHCLTPLAAVALPTAAAVALATPRAPYCSWPVKSKPAAFVLFRPWATSPRPPVSRRLRVSDTECHSHPTSSCTSQPTRCSSRKPRQPPLGVPPWPLP